MTQSHILIVDDEQDIRMTLEAALRAEGYRVSSTGRGRTALEMIEADPPDLVLLDIMMPDIDGYEVCERIKENDATKGIVVVFASARGKTSDKVEGLDFGADDYVTKPFNIPELTAKLRVHFRVLEYYRKLEKLVDFAHNVNALELDAIARTIDSELETFITADRYSVFTVDSDGERFRLLAHNHEQGELDDLEIDIHRSPFMFETRRRMDGILVTDFPQSRYTDGMPRAKYTDGFALCLPLKVGSNFLGVMNLSGNSQGFFNKLDFSFVALVAEILSASFNNVRHLEHLRKLAVTDGLTQLLNHRSFHEQLASEFERAKRFNQPLSVVMIDIDYFKQINDTHGHLAGDVILKQLAERLKVHLRKIDTVARYGGEEFAILLPQTAAEEAKTVTERIRTDVESVPFETEKGPLDITVSLGICDTLMLALQSGAELLQRADEALYRAKRAGRNRTVMFQPEAPS